MAAEPEDLESWIRPYEEDLDERIRKIGDALPSISGAEIVVPKIRAMLAEADEILRSISALDATVTSRLREAVEATPELASYPSSVSVLLDERKLRINALWGLSCKIEEAMAGEFYHRMIRAADGLAPLWTVYTW